MVAIIEDRQAWLNGGPVAREQLPVNDGVEMVEGVPGYTVEAVMAAATGG